MPYEVVPYAPRYDAQIAELQTHLWCNDPAQNAGYARWKYRENPFFPEPLMRLALSGGRVVGMRGMIGTLWEVGGDASPHLLPHVDDLIVAPEHRNRGLVSMVMNALLAEAARRGFRFALSLGAGPVTFVSSLAAGWRTAGSFCPVRLKAAPRPATPWSVARRLPGPGQVGRWLRSRKRADAFARLDRHGSDTGPVSLSREPRPEAMADLVARLPWDGRVRHVRDAAYLVWRYRNPVRDYRFLFAGGESLHGYLVLHHSRADRADARRVYIVDWEGTDETVRDRLLATALEWGRFARVRAWTAGASESRLAQLRARGFEPLPRDTVKWRSEGLLVRALGDQPGAWRLAGRDLLDMGSWDMRMLYSMVG
jgi:GNAT superfamily N-acetyltransferase